MKERKECMAANNPSRFPNFEKFAKTDNKNPCVKEEFLYDLETETCWYDGEVRDTNYSVNLRSAPSMDSKIIGLIKPDSEFNISFDGADGWVKVKLKDGTTGYAYARYISRKSSVG